jgi:hypothetical protein
MKVSNAQAAGVDSIARCLGLPYTWTEYSWYPEQERSARIYVGISTQIDMKMGYMENLVLESYLGHERFHILRINLLNTLGLSVAPPFGDVAGGIAPL